MIYILDKKYFMKKAKKLVEPADYFIMDGEAVGTTMSTGEKIVSEKYTHSTAVAAFTPPAKLFNLLKEKDRKFNASKVDDVLYEFMNRKETVQALLSAVRAMFYDRRNNPKGLNIFIVLPNDVYKVMAKIYKKWYKKYFNIEFVYTKEELKEIGLDMLEDSLKNKQMDAIGDRLDELEKKFKIRKKDKDKKKKKHKKDKDSHKKDKKKKKKFKKDDGKDKSDLKMLKKIAEIDTWKW